MRVLNRLVTAERIFENPTRLLMVNNQGGIFWQLELDYNDTVEKNVPFIDLSRLMHVHKGMACF